ncbi:MAG TPA: DUF1326 domain-containing protein [Vicinamibacterales bacterium]|nr:DUF1326 domain-containing protein [Vicinamibacterales bacterium]
MRYTIAAVLAVVMGAGLYASDPGLTGDYVEVRTAEVFTGGCIMGSEGEVSGREAILAWRISKGSMYGVPLDGLSVVAVVAGDRNLGTHELGGLAPTWVKAVVMTDERANPAQQQALVALARSMAPAVVRDVIETKKIAITFEKDGHSVRVSAGAAKIDVATHVEHSPDCGAMRWFDPLARTDDAQVGLTRSQQWNGQGLGATWTQINRRSSYFGSFSFGR